MRSVKLIRHGTTIENAKGIHQGRAREGMLSAAGIAELRMVGAQLASSQPAVIHLSPRRRCIDSAEVLRTVLDVSDLIVEPRLDARDSGPFGGHARGGLTSAARALGVDPFFYRPEGGESGHDAGVRALAWLDEASCADHPVVGVTHGGVIASLIVVATGCDPSLWRDHVPSAGQVIALQQQTNGRWTRRVAFDPIGRLDAVASEV